VGYECVVWVSVTFVWISMTFVPFFFLNEMTRSSPALFEKKKFLT